MRRLRILCPFFLMSAVALGCGDKLMLIMRVRLAQLRLGHPVAVLALAEQDLPSSASIRQLPLQSAVKKAGHRFQVINEPAQLDEALKAQKYDLVLADVTVADNVSERVKALPNRPVVVPVSYKSSKVQDSATQKKFHCLLKAPTDSDQYFEAVDQALQWKTKGMSR